MLDLKVKLVPLIAALGILLSAAGVNAQDQEDLITFEINGLVQSDEEGPVANATIQLNFVKNILDESGNPTNSDGLVAVNTDSQGKYTLQVNLDPDWSDFILRIAASNLDTFKYNIPNEKQLTDAIRNSISTGVFAITVNWDITSRPNYKIELEEIAKYGESTDKGRLIRVRGVADKITKFNLQDGRKGEIWFYFEDGIAIRFVDNKRDKDFFFKPRITSDNN